MNTARSLHIGLNHVDPKHYAGWDGELAACEFDANDMFALAAKRGFKAKILLGEKATAKAVISAIKAAAGKLKSGDIFLVTYSGHGGQVPDLNGDEGKFGDARDRKDETWCLFDREFIDDELAALWATFAKGVRILLLSDSCHSASVARARPTGPVKPAGRYRLMPREKAAAVYEEHKALYDAIQLALTGSEQADIKASVISISGCMDNQESSDGNRNGLFTETLLATWTDGGFEGGYREFRDAIASRMPSYQTPVLFVTGAVNHVFENQQPFTKELKKIARKSLAGGVLRSEGSSGKPIDIILGAMNDSGYHDARDGGTARPDSDMRTWFRNLDKEDDAKGIPTPQRTAQFVMKVQGALGIPISATDLIAGKYRNPQLIADLA